MRILRERVLHVATIVIAVVLLPIAWAVGPGGGRRRACQWALGLRFPRESLTGLAAGTRAAFTAARTEAFWRDGVLIGLTSGHRDAGEQHRLFAAEVRRTGSAAAARLRALPPEESRHVAGTALDVRPVEGARWLEVNGGRYDLYRTYDNEWWHFEHHPGRAGLPPVRLPHPGAARTARHW
ncbi:MULTISPECIES: D-alanyl-D-alanine carboxypeptidase family protein [Actinokineospora]|uniref:D-alanyl-D-alanine carboxypeptidase family protein n=1 Tax=Actinokineospora TaxID=39845 RepID=UPI0016717F59|nr:MULTISPECIES: D-alanyl-D-alanine carboxypeptidase family protein [Actinokineospora]